MALGFVTQLAAGRAGGRVVGLNRRGRTDIGVGTCDPSAARRSRRTLEPWTSPALTPATHRRCIPCARKLARPAAAANEAIAFDASWGVPPSGLPGPAELLATAFAACLLKNLARAEQFLSLRYTSAQVEVSAPPGRPAKVHRDQLGTTSGNR